MEYVSYVILRYIRKRKLHMSVIFIPGRKLRENFCTSRPLDRPSCSSLTSNICERLEDNVDYQTTHPVYQITCVLLGIPTKLFDVICHMILIGSHFSEARGGDRIHKCTESPHMMKLEYAVPKIRAM